MKIRVFFSGKQPKILAFGKVWTIAESVHQSGDLVEVSKQGFGMLLKVEPGPEYWRSERVESITNDLYHG